MAREKGRACRFRERGEVTSIREERARLFGISCLKLTGLVLVKLVEVGARAHLHK